MGRVKMNRRGTTCRGEVDVRALWLYCVVRLLF